MKKIFKYVPTGGPKLDGINTGVVDLGSSSLKFKRINGKRIQSEAALSAKYEEATEAFRMITSIAFPLLT